MLCSAELFLHPQRYFQLVLRHTIHSCCSVDEPNSYGILISTNPQGTSVFAEAAAPGAFGKWRFILPFNSNHFLAYFRSLSLPQGCSQSNCTLPGAPRSATQKCPPHLFETRLISLYCSSIAQLNHAQRVLLPTPWLTARAFHVSRLLAENYDVKVPSMGESVSEGTVSAILKKIGMRCSYCTTELHSVVFPTCVQNEGFIPCR